MHDNDKEMYSAHNEIKSVVAEKFLRDFNKRIYNQYSKMCIWMIKLMNTIKHTVEPLE